MSKAEGGKGCGERWPSIASTVPAPGQGLYDRAFDSLSSGTSWHMELLCAGLAVNWAKVDLHDYLPTSCMDQLSDFYSSRKSWDGGGGGCGPKGTTADSSNVPLQSVCNRGN